MHRRDQESAGKGAVMRVLRRIFDKLPEPVKNALKWLLLILVLAAITIIMSETIPILPQINGLGFGAKTFWDWLQLIIVPLILAVTGVVLNTTIQRTQREREEKRAETERSIADDRLKEQAWQSYLDKMTELLLKEQLQRSGPDDNVRTVARARTLTTLRGLDGERKGALLRFLYESKLIDGEKPVVDLSSADLREAVLVGAELKGANLGWTFLVEANFFSAGLKGASLAEARLTGANFEHASLEGTNLSGANLRGAKVTSEQLAKAILDENTIMPNGKKNNPASTPTP
jgi:hypothetical protein